MRRKQPQSATLIILLIISAGLLITISHILVVANQTRLADERLMTARANLLHTIQKYQYLPSVLSKDVRTQFAIRSDQTSALLNQLMRQYQEVSGIDVIYVMNNKGRVIAGSDYDRPGSHIGRNYHFRPYFRDAIESGRGLFFGLGEDDHTPGVYLSARMKSPDGFEGFDAFDGVVVAKIEAVSLARAWPGIENDFLLLDDKNTILLGARDEWRYNAPATLGPTGGGQINAAQPSAGKAPRNLLEREYRLRPSDLALWKIMGGWYIASQHPFFDGAGAGLPNKNWRIISLRRYRDSLPRTLYLAVLIGALLWSLYLIVRHRRIMDYSRDLKRQYESRRQTELQALNSRLEKRVEQRTAELKRMQKELIRQEKMAALGRMATAIVHELSQPLTALKTALGSLEIRYQRQDLEGLGKSVANLAPLPEKMYDIITQLRLFAYQGATDTENIDVNAYIRRYIAGLDTKRVAVRLNTTGDARRIRMNPVQLDIVLNNLVQNALDAVAQAERPEIGIETRARDDWVTINVIDNGNGPDAKTARHIFEPFFTTKVIGRGLGLGLAITRNIIKEYGGEISMRRKRDKTRFSVVLPSAEMAAEDPPPAGPAAQ